MMLEPPRRQLPAEKEIRIRLSARLHLHLHARKIIQGKTIHETVTAALDAYFATQPQRARDDETDEPLP